MEGMPSLIFSPCVTGAHNLSAQVQHAQVTSVCCAGPEGLAFTFRSRLATSSRQRGADDTPGPGFYHTEAPAASRRGCSLPPKPSEAATARRAIKVTRAAAAAPRVPVQLLSAETTCVSKPDVRSAAIESSCSSSSAGAASGACSAAAAVDEQRLTLAQLSMQLAALLRHKKGKQLRMQQYCLSA
jgi:hypothetical protein